MSLEKKSDDQKNDAQQKHKDRDPVDPMHISHPLGIRRVRIALLYIKVFGYLPPDSHNVLDYLPKINNTALFELFVQKSSIFAPPRPATGALLQPPWLRARRPTHHPGN
jgi:hypothetical protein